jgi:hypothetical protein
MHLEMSTVISILFELITRACRFDALNEYISAYVLLKIHAYVWILTSGCCIFSHLCHNDTLKYFNSLCIGCEYHDCLYIGIVMFA